MNRQKKLGLSLKTWLAVVSVMALVGIALASTAAARNGHQHGPNPLPTRSTSTTPPAPPPPPPPPPPTSDPAGPLAQWTEQYGADVTALLDAANNDMSQISMNVCNSNSQFCTPPDCGDTVAAANKLGSDPVPPDANITNYLRKGALELTNAADHCATVQDFTQGYANIGNAAQALGLSPTG